jgi:hypothetical protein
MEEEVLKLNLEKAIHRTKLKIHLLLLVYPIKNNK